jgi:hypothetical protein
VDRFSPSWAKKDPQRIENDPQAKVLFVHRFSLAERKTMYRLNDKYLAAAGS